MKKELKDYLHLYIGCEIKVTGKEFIDGGFIGELTGIINGFLLIEHKGDSWASIKKCKPILRPLSDMTEEEANEFFGDVMNFRGQFQFKYGFKYRYEDGFHLIYDNSTDKWYTIIKPDANGLPVFNCTYSMEDALWLLSKHFDLFGLVESGLAIDSQTLKEKI